MSDIELIIIEDNPTKTFDIDVAHHYSWNEIDADLGEDSWVISRRDSAIRSYGFLLAYRLGSAYTYSLDDDCYFEEEFFNKHISKMENTPRWTELILGMRTRGIPYRNVGKMDNVVANIGLWSNVPDYDAVQSLFLGDTFGFKPPANIDRVLSKDQYCPIVGMNFAFKRIVAPLCYFPLMGKDSPFSRFDDIWFGIIFKKICDHLGFAITVGHPIIKHTRASNPFVNLIREASGIQMNETFWGIIDKIELTGTTPRVCMEEVGVALVKEKGYLGKLGTAVGIWATFFYGV